MAPFALRFSSLTATGRSSPTACVTTTTSFEYANRSIDAVALASKISQYTLNIHASPFELLSPEIV